MTGRRTAMLVVLLLPLAALGGWLASGHGFFTSAGKMVNVEVRDEAFGDVQTQVVNRPGPVLGYYIGLDLVGGCTAVAGVFILLMMLKSARKRGPTEQ